MSRRFHLIVGLLAPPCIASFFACTVFVERLGSRADVAMVEALIVTPGLWILIPTMAAAGISGMVLAKSRAGRLSLAKSRRMPLIAANGLLVLRPCAIFLARWSAAGTFDTAFEGLQAVALIAGLAKLGLMGLNVRDGLRMARRSTSRQGPPPSR